MQLSLFSISYAGFWGQHRLTLPEFIAKAADLGFDAVMLAGKRPHVSPLDMTEQQLQSLRGTLAQHRVRCDVIAAYTDLAGGPAAEVPHLEMQIAYVESLARIASRLGAKFVRVFTAYESPGRTAGTLWRQVVTTLQEMSDRAATHGVTLAVQNHHDVGVHTDSLLELLHDVDRPNCRLGFDAWSPALRGEDLYEAARKAAPFTVITTSADYVRLPRFVYQPDLINYVPAQPDLVRAVPFGDGFIDYKAFFAGLRDGGFNGIATFEMCSPIRGGGSLENLDRYASRYVTWMKDHGFAIEGRGGTAAE
jgi:sugar phosphate isomerase/epimerase